MKFIKPGENFEFRSRMQIIGSNKYNKGKQFIVDPMWPDKIEGEVDTAGVDEGSALLLTGLVAAIKPNFIFETGTHKGRSTRALADGVTENGFGQILTVDAKDFGFLSGNALTNHQKQFVTQVIGPCPGILKETIFQSVEKIDLAYLDGGHTRDVLEPELQYVLDRTHGHCVVVVDNSVDDFWHEIRETMDDWKKVHNCVTLPTMCGFDIMTFFEE